MILREKRAKRGMKVWKTEVEKKWERGEKNKRLLREATVKIGLKQKEDKEGIVVEILLNSRAMELVIS